MYKGGLIAKFLSSIYLIEPLDRGIYVKKR